jgi:hypothetical protein
LIGWRRQEIATAIFSSGKMNTPQTPIMQTWPTPQTAITQSRRSDPTGGQRWHRWTFIALVIVSFFLIVTSRCQSTEPGIQSVAVFSCQFQRAQDKNADKQPDAWRRRRDRDHPSFVQSEITPRDPQAFRKAKETETTLAKVYHALESGVWDPNYVPEITPPQLSNLMDSSVLNDCYEVRMDGGAFEIVSPRFDIDTRFDYLLEAEIETQKLAQHSASVEIRLINSQGEVFATHSTGAVTATSDWNLLRTSNMSTDQEGRIRAEVCMRVQPLSKKFGRGVARFDNIRLMRRPNCL